MERALDELLASARDGGLFIERVPRSDFHTPGRLEELHAFSDRLMAEPLAHFTAHAHTNDELHVFRSRRDAEIVGLAFVFEPDAANVERLARGALESAMGPGSSVEGALRDLLVRWPAPSP